MKIFDALFGCWHKRISFPQTSKQDSAAARPPRSPERMWCVSTVVPSLLTTGKKCVFSPPLRNSLLPMHVWKLRPEARKSGEVKGHETAVAVSGD